MKNLYWYLIVFSTIGFFTYSYISDSIKKAELLKEIKNEINVINHEKDSVKNVTKEIIYKINKNKDDKKTLEDSLTNLNTQIKNSVKSIKNTHTVFDTIYMVDTISYKKEDVKLFIIKN
jgi:hypothetical protein